MQACRKYTLNDLPMHVHPIGKAVRYLPLPPDISVSFPPGSGLPVRCVVFPLYQAQGETTITPLNAAEALSRLTEAGYDMGRRMDAVRVAELVDWIAELDCYELRFNSLAEAISRLKQLLS